MRVTQRQLAKTEMLKMFVNVSLRLVAENMKLFVEL